MKVKTMFQSACSVIMALAMVMTFARCSGDDTDEDVITATTRQVHLPHPLPMMTAIW